jgi:hypothetical protein
MLVLAFDEPGLAFFDTQDEHDTWLESILKDAAPVVTPPPTKTTEAVSGGAKIGADLMGPANRRNDDRAVDLDDPGLTLAAPSMPCAVPKTASATWFASEPAGLEFRGPHRRATGDPAGHRHHQGARRSWPAQTTDHPCRVVVPAARRLSNAIGLAYSEASRRLLTPARVGLTDEPTTRIECARRSCGWRRLILCHRHRAVFGVVVGRVNLWR